jgi:hypothetical protein
MAINSTNTIATKLGVNITSAYIRVRTYDNMDGSIHIEPYFYADKASFQANETNTINSILDDALIHAWDTDVLVAANHSIDNKHDLVIAKLVERGLDVAKLAKTDLV